MGEPVHRGPDPARLCQVRHNGSRDADTYACAAQALDRASAPACRSCARAARGAVCQPADCAVGRQVPESAGRAVHGVGSRADTWDEALLGAGLCRGAPSRVASARPIQVPHAHAECDDGRQCALWCAARALGRRRSSAPWLSLPWPQCSSAPFYAFCRHQGRLASHPPRACGRRWARLSDLNYTHWHASGRHGVITCAGLADGMRAFLAGMDPDAPIGSYQTREIASP